ncbi:hypothetical protein PISMIDRAFT_686686 [Pisolithus microcarpus 441]|uniref:Unplaced genomic scaffold scaffold_184, whole genome shotgun sequence n=1 Tax=Pisolithus microcarpus 441 TaxID=765257 RepID=A0A0C9Z861_9AGAM|nr:hypothetical protein BKA83DRAFT_686686 [Pisolithus microcarpus]KIK16033.1 hypothetical protein PISMIDRAFT_686686 [Pisolithus microcarpus 441]
MSLPPFDHDAHAKFTEPPNPSWTFAQKIENTESGRRWLEGEERGWKVINTDEEDTARLYPLMTSAIVPRPIAFVSSVSTTGVENLAPFSWFNMVTNNPPLVSFCCRNDPQVKDTPTNVRNGLGFTVNIISEPFVENANVASINAPPEFDEWTISGLTKAPSIHVKAPRVKESAFSMECELFQAIDITHPVSGQITTTMILAHIKYIHVRNDVLNERGVVDITKYKPIARLGDISYGRVGDVFRLARPVWDREKEKIESVLENGERGGD